MLSTDHDLLLDSEHVPVRHPSGLAWLQTSWLNRRGDDAESMQPLTKVGKRAEHVDCAWPVRGKSCEGSVRRLGSCASLAATCISPTGICLNSPLSQAHWA